MTLFAEVGSSLLLFCLVFGMSATVELDQIQKQITNWKALLIGISLQFVIQPFIGFCMVKIFQFPAVTGIILMVITSSPGGSYSNLWCSLWNAELSLSLTMTAFSTILSTVLLPANLLLYTRWTYSNAVVQSLDWYALFLSIVVVIGGIACGLIFSIKHKHHPTFHRRANLMGNCSGILLIILSATVSSTKSTASVWDQNAAFYIGVALPAAFGLLIASYLAKTCGLEKPERVAVAVEGCYQNTGIATSVAITMFAGNETELATAIGVPLYYGMVEATLLALFCVVCWQKGWTKAPPSDNICRVLYHSYEVKEEEAREEEIAIEVVVGQSKTPEEDLVFCQRNDGDYIIDTESLQKVSNRVQAEDHTDNTVDESETDDLPSQSSPQSERGKSFVSSTQSLASTTEAVQSNTECDLDTQRTGTLGRTVSTIRARVTGYRRANEQLSRTPPIVPSVLSDESRESLSPGPTEREATQRAYKSLPFQSPEPPHSSDSNSAL